jgi:NAD(P)-dependent dehydrogenase (short-subunit alcohol dehydrogenase family)
MRTWLVTGGSKGLGAAIAKMALEKGERVAIAARTAATARGPSAEFPETALPIKLDVADIASIDEAIREVEKWAGPIDVLVNNAGQGLHGAIEETSDAELRRIFDVNFFGAARLIRAVLPGMRSRRSGRVLNIGSVAGFVANPGTGAYCATKFALEALTEALRKEVSGLGIRVSSVAPGGMRTAFNGSSIWQAGLQIPDYDGSVHDRIDDLRRHAGTRGSDVDAVAAAIWALSVEQDPAPHLILGHDAIERIEQKLSLLSAQLAHADPLSPNSRDRSHT